MALDTLSNFFDDMSRNILFISLKKLRILLLSSQIGGIVINPFILIDGKSLIWYNNSSSISGITPDLFSSLPMFTSTRISVVRFLFWETLDISLASLRESTDWIRSTLPTICLTLLLCKWPINCNEQFSTMDAWIDLRDCKKACVDNGLEELKLLK